MSMKTQGGRGWQGRALAYFDIILAQHVGIGTAPSTAARQSLSLCRGTRATGIIHRGSLAVLHLDCIERGHGYEG